MDLAVISFPVTPPLDLPLAEAEIALGLWPREVLRHMAQRRPHHSPLAAAWSRLRGGLCRGELLHTADLVFGPAFIEAYRLERKVAVLPRIAVSKTAYGTDRSLFARSFFAMTPVTRSTTSITCQHFPCSGARLITSARASRLDEMDNAAEFALSQPASP